MSLEKKVYDRALQMRLSLHNFGSSECMFYKGFKFEKKVLDDGTEKYSAYNIRPMYYKQLSEDEMDIIIRFGIMMASDLMSYGLYQNIIDRYVRILSSGKSGYKMVEKFNKNMEFYKKKCESILTIHNKNKEMFVQSIHNH